MKKLVIILSLKWIQEFQALGIVKQCYYQNALYVTVKKSRFIKKQEANGLLSSSGLKTPLRKIPLLGYILFWM